MTDGQTYWRGVPELTHETLCRALNMDPIRTQFDIPREHRQGSHQDGVILFNGQAVGRIWVAKEGESYRDLDPTDTRSFWDTQPTRLR